MWLSGVKECWVCLVERLSYNLQIHGWVAYFKLEGKDPPLFCFVFIIPGFQKIWRWWNEILVKGSPLVCFLKNAVKQADLVFLYQKTYFCTWQLRLGAQQWGHFSFGKSLGASPRWRHGATCTAKTLLTVAHTLHHVLCRPTLSGWRWLQTLRLAAVAVGWNQLLVTVTNSEPVLLFSAAHINALTSKVALLRKLPDDWKHKMSCWFKWVCSLLICTDGWICLLVNS